MRASVKRFRSSALARLRNSTRRRSSTTAPIRFTKPGAGTPGLFIGSSHVEYTTAGKSPEDFSPGLSSMYVRAYLAPPASAAAPSTPARTTGTSAAGTAAPAPRTALRLGPGFVHDEVPIAEEAAIEHLDGLGRFFLGG